MQKALRVSGSQFNKRCIESDKQEAIELAGASFVMGSNKFQNYKLPRSVLAYCE